MGSNKLLRTAGRHLVKVLGTATVAVTLGMYKTNVEALVMNKLDKPLILGNEFLKEHTSTICYNKSELTIRELDATVIVEIENKSRIEVTNEWGKKEINTKKDEKELKGYIVW